MAPPTPQNMGTSLHLRLFGSFHLACGGVDAPAPRSRAAHWILAWLIMRRERPVERDWLAETLWPRVDRDNALFNLRRNLTELRKILGAQSHRLQSPTAHTLTFDTADIECDLLAFTAALTRDDAAAREQAVSLYTGDLLEGCHEEWILPLRAWYERQYLDALEWLAEEESARCAWGKAADWLRQLVARDPTREHAHQRLMEMLAAQGDFAAVTEAYHRLRLTLHKTLNASPSEQTVALYKSLQQQTQPLNVISAPPRVLPSERVFDTLPRPLGALIGREWEQTEVAQRLQTASLVTLTGAGGIGKTRLALQVASTQAATFLQGVVWVRLEALSSASQVEKQIAILLNLSEQPNETTIETLIGYLRNRSLLLVLDNCEHLLQACAELAQTLLHACAQVKILATSRQALGLFGEDVWRLPSLAVPELQAVARSDHDCLQSVRQSDAARLFMVRAQAVQRDFLLTRENAMAVTQICHKLDGIPLALELAAAWVSALSVGQIAHRLDDQFALLTNGDRAVASRHQTLRNTLQWSYSLLESAEQTLLSRLAVFAGGWTLAAAEAICLEGNGIEAEGTLLLRMLVEKSLVETSEWRGETRYRLLEPIRQYAQSLLVAADAETAVRQKHLAYYLALAERLSYDLEGPLVCEGLEYMEAEYANCCAAEAFCFCGLAETDPGNVGLRLAIALSPFRALRGRFQEGISALQEALRRHPAEEDTDIQAAALRRCAIFANRMGDLTKAHSFAGEAEARYRQLPPSSGLLGALRMRGNTAMMQDNYVMAESILSEGIALCHEMDDLDNEARFWCSLGTLAKLQGKFEQAKTYLEKAVRHFQTMRLIIDEAVALHSLANVLNEHGDRQTAKRHYLRSLEIHRQVRSHAWIGTNLVELAGMAVLEGKLVEARTLGEEALSLCHLGHRAIEPQCLQILSNIERQEKNWAKARAFLAEAIARQIQLGLKRNLTYSLFSVGVILHDEERWVPVVTLFAAMFRLREAMNAPLTPLDVAFYDQKLHQCFVALGEEKYEQAHLTGEGMTLDQAVSFALDPVG